MLQKNENAVMTKKAKVSRQDVIKGGAADNDSDMSDRQNDSEGEGESRIKRGEEYEVG